jgi:hypothetical protein
MAHRVDLRSRDMWMDRSGGSLPKPEVAEDREYDDYDADDVEDVDICLSPFTFQLYSAGSRAQET